jgi:hypothetical protein
MHTMKKLKTGLIMKQNGSMETQMNEVQKIKHSIKSTRKSYKVKPSGNKLRKAAEKHRADHSNPGGIVSNYFREKNLRV